MTELSRDELFLRLARSRWMLTDEEVEQCRAACRETGQPAAKVVRSLQLLDSYAVEMILTSRKDTDVQTRLASEIASPAGSEETRGTLETSDPAAALEWKVAERGKATPPESLPEGETFGRYTLLRELGRGAMAAVYEAKDNVLKRTLALKILRAEGPLMEKLAERFEREAQTVAQMGRHPHVVQVFDFGREGRSLYFTMDLVRGGTLLRWLADESPNVRRLVEVAHQVASALEHAHAHGVVHRDLKPDNILMNEQGQPLVSDFGLARAVEPGSRLTVEGQVMGTPAYMPPEQAQGLLEQVGAASDVYSFGVVLYEALAGENPFRRAAVGETLLAAIQHEPAALRKKKAHVPAEVETIVMKCLEKETSRRYPDGGALRAELERWLKGEPIQARPPSVWYRARRWAHRRKAVCALIVTLVLAAAGAVGAWFLLREREQVEQELRGQARDVHGTVLYKDAERILAVGLTARRYGETGKLEAAVGEVVRKAGEALRADPNRVEAHFMKEWALLLQARWKEAVSELNAFLTRWDGDPFGHYLRGRAYLSLYRETREAALRARKAKQRSSRRGGEGGAFDSGWHEELDEAALLETHPELGEYRERARTDFSRLEKEALKPAGLREAAYGLTALTERRYAEAKKWLEKAVELDRERDEAWTALAGALNGLWDEGTMSAEEVLSGIGRVLEANAGLDTLYLVRARVKDELAAALFYAEGQRTEALALWKEAEQDATKAMELWPRRGEEYAVRAGVRSEWADCLWDAGEEEALPLLEKALEDCDAALQLLVDRQDALYIRAQTRQTLGDWKLREGSNPVSEYGGAIEDCEELLGQEPGDEDTLNERALARAGLGDWKALQGEDPGREYEQAIADLSEAMQGSEAPGIFYFNRAELCMAWAEWKVVAGESPVKEYERALQDFGEVLRANPDERDGHLRRGDTWQRLGEWKASQDEDPASDYGKALKDFDDVLEHVPDHPEALYGRGLVWESLGDWKSFQGADPTREYGAAMEDYDSVLAQYADDVDTFTARAMVRVSLAEWHVSEGREVESVLEKALAEFGEVLKQDRTRDDALRGRARAYELLERWPEALADYEAADKLTRDPELPAVGD